MLSHLNKTKHHLAPLHRHPQQVLASGSLLRGFQKTGVVGVSRHLISTSASDSAWLPRPKTKKSVRVTWGWPSFPNELASKTSRYDLAPASCSFFPKTTETPPAGSAAFLRLKELRPQRRRLREALESAVEIAWRESKGVARDFLKKKPGISKVPLNMRVN